MKKVWLTKPLRSVCDLQNGYAFKSSDYIESSNTLNTRMSSIRPDGSFDPEHNQRFLPDYYAKEYSSFLLNEGDLIIAMTDMAGDPKILGVPTLVSNQNGRNFLMNQRVGKLFGFSDNVRVPFLRYFLTSPSIKEFYKSKGAGGLQINISKADILSAQIPLPAIAEQDRIVGILDEAFDGIATAKASAEKNLQNARALFESHLQSVFTQRGKGWEDRTLDQVCIVERGSSPRPIKKYFTTNSDGVNWIKIGDTEEGGKYVYSTAQKITPVGSKQSRYVKEGDFILTNSMSFGRPYIMKTSGYIHDGWFVLRLNASIDTDYFYYLLSSRFIQSQFARLACGAVVKNISGDLVKKAVLPIPPLTHQHVIVKKLLELSAETQHLEAIYQGKLTALDELKKSLLHDAFRGAL